MRKKNKPGNNDQEPKLCIKRSSDGNMEVPGLTRCNIDTTNRLRIVVYLYLCPA